MKKILLTVALLAAFVVNASAQAVIKYDKSSHDFGKFDDCLCAGINNKSCKQRNR